MRLFSPLAFSPKALLLSLALTSVACGPSPSSQILVSDTPHTSIKRQSIGNCWLYAMSSWTESLHLQATGKEFNVSESYWTYWDWYERLIQPVAMKSLSTGGDFQRAQSIITRYGVLAEGDFLPNEADLEMSEVQRSAQQFINTALQPGGMLAGQRTSFLVLAALDKAFGVSGTESYSRAIPATRFVVSHNFGRVTSLAKALRGDVNYRWNAVNYPVLFGKYSVDTPQGAYTRASILRRVMAAVNNHRPVIITTLIDFNAVAPDSENAMFSADRVLAQGPGFQAGHLMVLEDYAVTNVPGIGALGEGEMTDAAKEAALRGRLSYIVTKNSWGKDRPDRPWLKDGYTRFDRGYIDRPLPFHSNDTDMNSPILWRSAVSGFVLPPGY